VPVRRGGRARARGPDRKPLLDENGDPLVLERQATFVRWTFVIDKDGKIAYKNTKVNPMKDSQQVLEFIQASESLDHDIQSLFLQGHQDSDRSNPHRHGNACRHSLE